jgi:Carbohydrate binding domain
LSLLFGCAGQTGAQTATTAQTGSFPRIGNVWWGGALYSANPSQASQVQLFLGPGFSTAQASMLKAADPNAVVLVAFNLMETTAGVPAVPSSYYLLDTNGNQICNWPGNPPNYILNMTNPTVAKFVGQYAAQLLAQSGSAYNGVFFDNLVASIGNMTKDCYGNAIQISSQGNGVADNPTDLNAAWSAGLYSALATFKASAPDAYAVAHANQIPLDIRSLGVLNGDSFGFDVPNIREGGLAFGNLWDAYHQWFQSGQGPILAAIQSSPPNQIAYGYGYQPTINALPQTAAFGQTFYPNMRFGLALAMMDDGYFLHDFGDNSSPVTWWYDEYNFNMGMPAAPYQLIGNDFGPNQLVNSSFESGLSSWLFSVSSDGVAAANAYVESTTFQDGVASAHVNVSSADTAAYRIVLEQDNLALTAGTEYQVDFWAKSDVYFPLHLIMQGGKPLFANYGMSTTLTLGSGWNHYTISFIASNTASDGRLEFQFGCYPGNVWIDNVRFSTAPVRLYRRDFQNGVVLLNGTNTPQTLSLESGLSRFSGPQAPRYQYIVDDADPTFTASGNWLVSTFDTGWRKPSGPYYHAWNSTLHELDSTTGSARWNLGIPADGQYTLQVWLPAAPSAGTWTSNAVYQVIQGGTVLASTSLNQATASQGDHWFNLGTFTLNADQNPVLQVQNGSSGSLIADAVYVFSAVDRYNDGSPVAVVTIPPMDGILLQRQSPSQSITFPSPGNQVVGISTVLNASASSGLVIEYSSSTLDVCQVAGNEASFSSTGTCSITARQGGNSGYTAAVPVTQTFKVFAPQSITVTAPATQILGAPPVSIAATSTSGLAVTLSSSTQQVCIVSGSAVSLVSAGECTIVASQAGNSTYAAAQPVSLSFAVLAPQIINFGSLPLAATGGLPVQLVATASSALPVAFTSTSRTVCTVSGNAVTLLSAGTCSIVASQAGDALHAAAPTVTQSFTVVPNLLSNGGMETTASPWLFSVASDGVAQATSKLDTSSFVDGKSALDVDVLHAAATSYNIDLEQAHLSLVPGATYNVQFWAKADVGHSVQVEMQGGAPAYPVYGLYQTARVGTAWALYSYTFTAPIVTTGISDARLEFHFGASAGDVWIDDVQLFGSAGIPQTITFPNPGAMVFGSAAVTLKASSTSGLAVAYASNTPATCSVFGAQATPVVSGTCSITASQAGNSAYQAAASVSQTFPISPASQAITFTAIPNQIYGVAPFAVTASASSGLAVTLASSSSSVCTLSGSTVSIVGAGICALTATQPGNGNYASAAPVSQTFTVASLAQTLTFAPIQTQAPGALPFTATATSSSGLPVAITSQSPAVCTVSAGQVSLVTSGTCTLTASQAGNSGYAAAAPAVQSFAVMPNLVTNGGFDAGSLSPWKLLVTADGSVSASASLDTANALSVPASALVNVSSAALANWHVDLEQVGLPIVSGKPYVVQFWAQSSTVRSIQLVAQGGSPSFANYGMHSTLSLGTGWKQYRLSFTANQTANDCRLEFYVGSTAGTVHLENVQFFATN